MTRPAFNPLAVRGVVERLLSRGLYSSLAAERTRKPHDIFSQCGARRAIAERSLFRYLTVRVHEASEQLRTLLDRRKLIRVRDRLFVTLFPEKAGLFRRGKDSRNRNHNVVCVVLNSALIKRNDVVEVVKNLWGRNRKTRRTVCQTAVPDQKPDEVRIERKVRLWKLSRALTRNLPLAGHRFPVSALYALFQ